MAKVHCLHDHMHKTLIATNRTFTAKDDTHLCGVIVVKAGLGWSI